MHNAMIRYTCRKTLLLTGAASLLFLTTSANAALAAETPAASTPEGTATAANSAPKDGLGADIVVTAQKRQQRSQDVGISITAVSGEQIHKLGFTSSTDISKIASNVSISGSYGGQESQFVIRGVTQNDFNDHVESVIAAYIDDSYIAMQQGQTFGLFDLDHVEVLKGPQGTLFGRNATGGLVQFITKKPTEQLDAFFDATYGSYNDARIEAAIGGSVAPGLKVRFAGLFEHADGYLHNTYPGNIYTTGNMAQGTSPAPGAGADLGGIDSNIALRGSMSWDIAPNLTLLAQGTYNHYISSSPAYQESVSTITVEDANGVQINNILSSKAPAGLQNCQIIKAGVCANAPFGPGPSSVTTRPVAGGNYFGYTDPDGNGLTTACDYCFKDGSQTITWGGSTKLVWNLGTTNVSWVNSYFQYKKHFLFDLDADPANSYFWIADSREHTLSEELRIDGHSGNLTWVTGAYYLHINNTSTNGFGWLPSSAYALSPEQGGVYGYSADLPRTSHLISDSYSAFGQAEYKITPKLTAIGGLRISLEKKNFELTDLFVVTSDANDSRQWAFSGLSTTVLGDYKTKTSETLYNWKAQLDWKPDANLLLYAGVTQGAKAGSFNSGDASVFPTTPNGATPIPYKPERLISYEAGFKESLLDRRLRFNGSVYYYDYHDYQAAKWTGVSDIIVNANGHFYGAEAELTGNLTRDLEISFNAGWQKNKLKNVPTGDGVADVSTTYSPEWTLSGLVRYTYPTEVVGGYVSVQGSGTYQSFVYQNLDNFAANTLPGWATFDARIGWTSVDNRLQIAVFAKNIFDKRYDTVGFDESFLTGSNLNAQGKPRTFGVNAKVKF